MLNERTLVSRNKREGAYAGHRQRHYRTGQPNQWCVTRSLREKADNWKAFLDGSRPYLNRGDI